MTSATETGTATDPVVVERSEIDGSGGAVVTVRLNRPDSRNALTTELKVALRDTLEAVARDDTARAVVLASSGKAFCVGQDLGEHAQALRESPDTALDTVPEHYSRIAAALAGMPKPVVAAINGACVGAGLGFALACDLRVAAAGTKLATAFAGIGFGGDSGLSATLAHAVGVSRATELMMLGEPFTVEQARDWGLVREVVEPDEVDGAAHALAARLAGGPTRAFAEIKAAIAVGAVSSLATTLDHEAAAQRRLGATDDHRDAVDAFLAKQKPTFRGR